MPALQVCSRKVCHSDTTIALVAQRVTAAARKATLFAAVLAPVRRSSCLQTEENRLRKRFDGASLSGNHDSRRWRIFNDRDVGETFGRNVLARGRHPF
jgi:hypothetical protein